MEKIYVLRGQGTNFFKIGRTSQSIESRIQQLQTGCPFALDVYTVFPTFFPSEVEKFLHSYLDEFRASGEWFEVDSDKLDSILAISQGVMEGNGPLRVEESFSGWQIVINERHGSGYIGASCMTLAEIEYQCTQIIQSAMHIMAKARQSDNPLLVNPYEILERSRPHD